MRSPVRKSLAYAYLPLVLLVLCLLLFGAALASTIDLSFFKSTPSTPMTADGEWTNDENTFWIERIEEVGGAEAYREFGKGLGGVSAEAQHTEAHGFGRALYAAEGVAGASVCDMQFSMGCHHEFIGQAIAAEGEGVVESLVAKCDALAGRVDQSGCRHGVGHGIQAWLGYRPTDLLKGLAWCRDIAPAYDDPYGGCASGLYMEYNLRVMTIPNSSARKVEDGNYAAPCDIVDPADESSCVFWLPQWWLTSARTQTSTVLPEEYKEVGAHCRTLPVSNERVEDCFRGIGAVVFGTAHSLADVRNACDEAGATPTERSLCRGFAATIHANEGRPNALEVCDGLEGAPYTYCKTYALEATVFDVLPVPL